ncbi:MAG TPA: transcription termination factor Rho, partial [Planctomycetota bacterium]
MATKKNRSSEPGALPFGAGTFDPQAEAAPRRAEAPDSPPAEAAGAGGHEEPARERSRRGRRGRGGRGRARGAAEEQRTDDAAPGAASGAGEEERPEVEPELFAAEEAVAAEAGQPRRPAAPSAEPDAPLPEGAGPVDPSATPRRSARAERRRRWLERRRRRRLGLPVDDLLPPGQAAAPGAPPREGQRPPHAGHPHGRPQGERAPHAGHPPREREPRQELLELEGMLVIDKGSHGDLRRKEADYLPSKDDVHVLPWQVQKFGLRDGAIVRGRCRPGHGRSRYELVDVLSIDGRDPREARSVPNFKTLTTIDPDFHYALGDGSGEVSLKVVDVICPIGRGQRGLIVAPPRSGKTILLQQIAKAVEQIYPDVHLMVLLVDERPEEATEWKRSVTHGEVFVSTNDEPAKKHVELAEVVWRRARRLVELGKDVILLLDSLTRLGRAANNVWGTSGKTMSGGIDSRALERPKALFGSARNTETAGSLTILGTALIETGSRMDQIIFEEFKGTGNMELVLSRKLSDRRIFPAIDLERSGTRKDEKLHSAKRLARCNTLRRVLMRMHFAEAMELLITKLGDV